jgi:hypothetical protein
MKYLTVSLVLLLVSLPIYAQQRISQSAPIETVPFVKLLASPETYTGKRVRVAGFLHVKFEDSALYLTKDDGDFVTLANAVWIEYDSNPSLELQERKRTGETRNDLKQFDGKYVLLEGTFTPDRRGHLGAFQGTIEKVTRVLEKKRWYDGSKELR